MTIQLSDDQFEELMRLVRETNMLVRQGRKPRKQTAAERNRAEYAKGARPLSQVDDTRIKRLLLGLKP